MFEKISTIGIGTIAVAILLPPVIAQANLPVYVTPVDTNTVLLPTSLPNSSYLSNTISIFASPGEYEPATFSVRAPQDLHQVTMQVSDLAFDGHVIPASAIDLKVVEVWYQGGHPNRLGDVPYLTPELLVNDDSLVNIDTTTQTNILKYPYGPIDAATLKPVNIAANTLKQFWATVHVPNGATAGNYTGTLQINASGGQSTTLDLQIEVLPIRLKQPKLDYMIYYGATRLDPSGLGEYTVSRSGEYVLKKTEEQFIAELQDLKAHGITTPMFAQDLVTNPDGSYDFTLNDRAMTLIKQAGFDGASLLYVPYGAAVGTQTTPQQIQQMSSWVADNVALAQNHGFSNIYFYGVDEALDDALLAQRPAWEAVHAAGGKMFASAYSSFTNWFDLVGDLLDLGVEGTAPIAHDIEDIHALGHELVLMRNSPVNGPIQSLTTRANYGLGLWLSGFDGGMDFAYQFAHGNIYDDTDNQNWDYVYAYPTVHGVIDTVQWEAWREGVDDVRYLTTLLDAIDQAKTRSGASKTRAAFVESWMAGLRSGVNAETYYANPQNWYTLDPRINFAGRDLQQIRSQMAGYIRELQGDITVFRDTFENFTPGTSIAGQAGWYTFANPSKMVVNNESGMAFEGEQYLNFWGEGTFPYKLIDAELGPLSELSYYFRMGDHYGSSGGDSSVRFWWSGGHYPPGTFTSTEVLDTGALQYYDPDTGTRIDTGESIADDQWYKFSYTYLLATGEIRWMVIRASDNSVILDVPIAPLDTAIGENWSFSTEWRFNSTLPDAGFHVFIDKLGLVDLAFLFGDFDKNGRTNATDIDLLCGAIHDGGPADLFDVNNDGVVNLNDLAYEVETMIGTQFGDADTDGDVDLSDLATLATFYGQAGPHGWTNGDFDCDQDVDLADLSILATFYTGGQAQAFADFQLLTGESVPEPTVSAVVAALGVLTMGRMQRRS